MNAHFEVQTCWREDGIIYQELFDVIGGAKSRIQTEILNTKEAQVREALIALGWTPPKENNENDNRISK